MLLAPMEEPVLGAPPLSIDPKEEIRHIAHTLSTAGSRQARNFGPQCPTIRASSKSGQTAPMSNWPGNRTFHREEPDFKIPSSTHEALPSDPTRVTEIAANGSSDRF